MSRERRDLSKAFFTLGTFIMFLLHVFSGAQRWLDACGGLCPCMNTQGSLSPAPLRTLGRIKKLNSFETS